MKLAKKVGVIVFAAVHLATGCAVAPDRIKPQQVDQRMYDSYDCVQLDSEMARMDNALTRLSSEQQSSADTDDVLTFVGLVLFWPALFGLAATDDHEFAIAQLKGERAAAEANWTGRGCSIPAAPAA